MNRFFRIILIFLIILTSIRGYSQEERSLIREGNRLYREGNYREALEKFNKAREISGNHIQIESNIGSANYRDSNFESAVRNFLNVFDNSDDNREKANAFYNIGNSLLQAGDYDKSVEAYRNALRLDPSHDQSRYNLAVATKIMEQQPECQQECQQEPQDGDDEEEQEQEEQQDQDSEQEEEEREQEQDQREMSRDEMERLLEAIENIDRELQEDLHKNRFESERRVIERNW